MGLSQTFFWVENGFFQHSFWQAGPEWSLQSIDISCSEYHLRRSWGVKILHSQPTHVRRNLFHTLIALLCVKLNCLRSAYTICTSIKALATNLPYDCEFFTILSNCRISATTIFSSEKTWANCIILRRYFSENDALYSTSDCTHLVATICLPSVSDQALVICWPNINRKWVWLTLDMGKNGWKTNESGKVWATGCQRISWGGLAKDDRLYEDLCP